MRTHLDHIWWFRASPCLHHQLPLLVRCRSASSSSTSRQRRNQLAIHGAYSSPLNADVIPCRWTYWIVHCWTTKKLYRNQTPQPSLRRTVLKQQTDSSLARSNLLIRDSTIWSQVTCAFTRTEMSETWSIELHQKRLRTKPRRSCAMRAGMQPSKIRSLIFRLPLDSKSHSAGGETGHTAKTSYHMSSSTTTEVVHSTLVRQ
jgi:hypothetical protein